MRVLLSVLGVFTLFFMVPLARSFVSDQRCSSTGYLTCRMRCSDGEYAVRYCNGWTICCRLKKTEIKKKKLF
ncbi:beta-defensin 131A [Nannospalax galili]|uniref:Beta-defensin n=1 Tax=Nannospalax galili TaxID=1026970 RepID=A0A8C6RZC2_NANGA|nr:beta-defensin 131A [Nannospalax galili]